MVEALAQHIRDAMKEVAWCQWEALGAAGGGERRGASIVDPEALVLLSLALRNYEPRLWDALGWWAETRAGLLSVQRAKNLAGRYPPVVRERLGEFGARAHRVGRDFRWRSVAGPGAGSEPRRVPGVREEGPLLTDPRNLVLRLRMGLGVGVKADMVAYLLGVDGAWASVRVLTGATGYSSRAVRRAAEEMAAARLVRVTGVTPTEYRVVADAWAALLDLRAPLPAWRDWQALFAFASHFLEWVTRSRVESTSLYVLSREGRELVEAHRPAFSRNRIAIPEPTDFEGADFLDALRTITDRLVAWLRVSV